VRGAAGTAEGAAEGSGGAVAGAGTTTTGELTVGDGSCGGAGAAEVTGAAVFRSGVVSGSMLGARSTRHKRTLESSAAPAPIIISRRGRGSLPSGGPGGSVVESSDCAV
jgi:hypothetical protein